MNSLPKLVLICISIFFLIDYLNAQSGALDVSFNSIDKGYSAGDGPDGSVYASIVLPDGKILIGGDFDTYNGIKAKGVARILPNGLLDTSFQFSGSISVYCMEIQKDGKILIAGSNIIRINENGSVDSSFSSGTGINYKINDLVVLTDGKIIIGGSLTTYNNNSSYGIARINSDGTFDQSFKSGFSKSLDYVYALALQSDGKILVGGNFDDYQGKASRNIVRIMTSGDLDQSFNVGIGFNEDVNAIVLDSNENIYICGDFSSYNNVSRLGIILLNKDGTVNNSMIPKSGYNYYSKTIKLQSDGKILLGGSLFYNNASMVDKRLVVRLNHDGTPDSSFNPFFNESNHKLSLVNNIQVQANGYIILSCSDREGHINNWNSTLVRLQQNGDEDQNFNKQTGSNGSIETISILPNNKLFIGGWNTKYNGKSGNFYTRLNNIGQEDQTFNKGSGADHFITCSLVLPDGKILIAGYFNFINNKKISSLARLNQDGSLDNTFNPPFFYYKISAIALQSDGKIITASDDPNAILRRLFANGTQDFTFKSPYAVFYINTLTIQADDKILIGGTFNKVSGIPKKFIARLLKDGEMDPDFDSNISYGSGINTIAIHSDNSIYVGGNIRREVINGNGIIKLDKTGKIDHTFKSERSKLSGEVNKILIEPNGKLITAGNFGINNSSNHCNLAKLNFDGSLDDIFDPGTGANAPIHSMAVDQNGNILIGGEFTAYDNIGRNRIARIKNTIISSSEKISVTKPFNLIIFSELQSIKVVFDKISSAQITIYSIQGQMLVKHKVENYDQLDIQLPDFSGTYLIEIKLNGKLYYSKFIL